MEFSRQEYWSGLPFPPPGDLPDPGISCVSCIGRQVLYHSATWEAPLVAFQVFKQEPLLSELFYIQYCMHSTFLKYQVSSFEVGMYRCQNPSSGHIPELIPGLGWSLMLPHQLSHTSVWELCFFSYFQNCLWFCTFLFHNNFNSMLRFNTQIYLHILLDICFGMDGGQWIPRLKLLYYCFKN